jgi:crotonobetainyl-CoA:carnitine CoA-transferase CaiB-like acyl-CoA transferase
VPFRFSATPLGLSAPAPCLGEHNGPVLGSLAGLEEAELQGLEARGVIGTEPLTLRI